MFGKDMNLGNFKKMAEEMQSKMAQVQDELKERVVEGSAGGGAVIAYVNGAQEVVGIKLNPDVLKPEDSDLLADLITAAVNQGLEKSRKLSSEEMNKVTGGLAGLTGLPF
ncbi:MAG: YbaB/EbfC family nucleoid-associated protein [Planctomycetota bacterium]|nr:YbaB/EbfC family nucleoid-associated protein [Planctomycetota bacterium]MDI6788292.1 YbaB/EbfC family nucleoid-associated protein [Planctomycetota bacterium]